MAAQAFRSQLWRTLGGLALGQLLSLLIAATGLTSSQLARVGVDAPTSQSFCNYVLLAVVYGPLLLYRRKKLQAAYEVDAFCLRKGGSRENIGRDAALAHYIGLKPTGVLVIFHAKMSPYGPEELVKCKALSKIIGREEISRNSDKVILVLKDACINAFGGRYRSKLLVAAALGMAVKEQNPAILAQNILQPTLLKEARQSEVLKLLGDMPKDGAK